MLVKRARHQTIGNKGAGHFVHLDMLRGVAAILVLVNHARAYTFIPYSELEEVSIIWVPFYAFTSLGHQSVIVFFALSGFLVGGPMLQQIFQNTFSFKFYAFKRITRLWIVLLPALFLTMVLDQLGMMITNGYGYMGGIRELYGLGPGGENMRYAPLTLVANLLFLQEILTSPFGSNGPLWSLSYEFWYYCAFPFIFLVVTFRSGKFFGICSLAVCVALGFFLPFNILKLGTVWAAGALSFYFLQKRSTMFSDISSHYRAGAVIAIPFLMVISQVLEAYGDILLGISIAVLLPLIAHQSSSSRLYERLARRLSDISFSLYLAHSPVLVFLTATLIFPDRIIPGTEALAVFMSFCVTGLCAGFALWLLAERHTRDLQNALSIRLGLQSKPQSFPRDGKLP